MLLKHGLFGVISGYIRILSHFYCRLVVLFLAVVVGYVISPGTRLGHASEARSLRSHIRMHQDPISFLSPSSSLVSGGCGRIGHITRYD